MNIFRVIGTSGLALLACVIGNAVNAQDVTGKIRNNASTGRKLVYNAPVSDDAPSVRHDGITRSKGKSGLPRLFALAPEHVGTTTYAHPTLYWYQSDATKTTIEIGINRDDQIAPILETTNTAGRGIHKIELSKHNVKMEKGVEYEWHVTITNGDGQPSQDVVASGVIKQIDPPHAVSMNLATKKIEDLIYIFSEEGIWYDALECASKLIQQHPTNAEYRELRAELLDFGNLPDVAEYDRNPNSDRIR